MKLLDRNIFHLIKLFCILERKYEIHLIFRIIQIVLKQISFKSQLKSPLNKDVPNYKDNIKMNATMFSTLMNVAIDLYRATIVRNSRHP